MDVRRVDIRNFRGIKQLSWRLPKGASFVALIGPGDSAKSTILTAIDMALSDRWNLSVSDTDFFLGNIDEPINIRVALGDLPPSVRQHSALGMSLSGIDDAGDLHEDPDGDHEACVVVALTIDENLEPTWTAHRPEKATPPAIVTAAARRLLGTYKVDERIDSHLRWSRTSALGRLTEAKHGADEVLLRASRAARQAASNAIPTELVELIASVQQRLHTLGSGEFRNLQAGLDQSLSSSTGNLALYEGPVPLTNYGLGSRRLAGVAAQQLAHEGEGVLLIDEIEYGLEPHRLVNLLTHLRKQGAHSLVVTTTHSPTALQHLAIDDLGLVRRDSDGTVTVASFTPDNTELQKLLRRSPEAFLARRVVLAEGKTEYGVVSELVDRWNNQRATEGSPSAAALGVVAVEGSGGAGSIGWARVLANLGYDVVLFIDSDVPKDCGDADALKALGVTVVRWEDGLRTEQAVTAVLGAARLSALIQKAVDLSDDPSSSQSNFLGHLKTHGLTAQATNLIVDDWVSLGVSLADARAVVASAAHAYKWFKRVDKGRDLAAALLDGDDFNRSDAAAKVQALHDAIFAPLTITADDEPPPEPAAT